MIKLISETKQVIVENSGAMFTLLNSLGISHYYSTRTLTHVFKCSDDEFYRLRPLIHIVADNNVNITFNSYLRVKELLRNLNIPYNDKDAIIGMLYSMIKGE